jgi:hypothetical protein
VLLAMWPLAVSLLRGVGTWRRPDGLFIVNAIGMDTTRKRRRQSKARVMSVSAQQRQGVRPGNA